MSSQTQVQTQLQVELLVENSYDLNLTNQVSEERWHIWFSQWLNLLAVKLPRALSYEIGLQLTNDAQIQELNAQYRQKDQPTDVLAFAALENNFPYTEEMLASQPLYLGDIVISVDTAIRQAQEREHNLTTELAWLSAHGLLHLLGWDHPDEQSLIRMLNKQSMLLKSVGIVSNI
ncbi:hypothetical protein NIES932_17540 [Raphidiopsis curvata NIES-932]|nr:hypothetical protein NIES932_17540 [Raphidiopsis curvata NIES-932]